MTTNLREGQTQAVGLSRWMTGSGGQVMSAKPGEPRSLLDQDCTFIFICVPFSNFHHGIPCLCDGLSTMAEGGLRQTGQTLWSRVRDALFDEIVNGGLEAGDRLPPARLWTRLSAKGKGRTAWTLRAGWRGPSPISTGAMRTRTAACFSEI